MNILDIAILRVEPRDSGGARPNGVNQRCCSGSMEENRSDGRGRKTGERLIKKG
jgi:hypothetical protein